MDQKVKRAAIVVSEETQEAIRFLVYVTGDSAAKVCREALEDGIVMRKARWYENKARMEQKEEDERMPPK